MTPERWHRAMGIFDAALLLEQNERETLVDSSCSHDDELGQAVRALLIAHRDAAGFGSAPVMAFGSRLKVGSSFGSYRIDGLLGAGGMGEVYRAIDTNLKRSVAIKVVPGIFASDPERLARFQREAEVLAALNHPNIAQIYGLEKS